MSNIQTILEIITCPISGDVMKEPVIAADGQTYDREHLLQWLSRNSISPITREPLNEAGLYVNTSVKFMCDKYVAGEFDNLKNNARQDGSIQEKNQRELNSCEFDVGAKVVHFNKNTKKLITSFGCSNLNFNDIMNGPGIDLVMIIDLSGSTISPISTQDEHGNKLESGFSINDILRHTGKTVVAALRPQDRVAFIVFDDKAHNIFDFMRMTELNKVFAKDKIHNQKPNRGLTNIWGGCEMALQMLENRDDKSRNSAAILLTDGQPTKSPARGEKDKMISYKKINPFSTPFYGFGFGYVLKPYLLNELCAEATNGGVSHISDGTMVATVFNNTIGLIVNTACMDVKIKIRIIKDVEFNIENPIDGAMNYSFQKLAGDDSLVVELGSAQFQQSRETVVNINPLTHDAEIGIEYTYTIGGEEITLPEEIICLNKMENKITESESEYHYFRTFVVDKLKSMIMIGKKSIDSNEIKREKRKQLYTEVIEYFMKRKLSDPGSVALIDTWKDQVYIAVASDEPKYNICYDKWGMYYFEQLICALSKQYTPNFKDESCKIFGGEMFNAMVEVASDAFDNEPAPERTCVCTNTGTTRSMRAAMINNYASQATDVGMSQFNNQGGGCFTGDTQILIGHENDKNSPGLYKRVDQIKPGDQVITICDIEKCGMNPENRQKTKVLKVVETKYDSLSLIRYMSINNQNEIHDNIGITYWHPIKFSKFDEKMEDSHWGFPKESDWWAKNHNDVYQSNYTTESNVSVYTFILESGHVVFLGKHGILAITLAHHYKNGILNHAYFGTDEIKKDLEKIPGWEQGHVVLRPEWYKKTGSVTEKYNLATVGGIIMSSDGNYENLVTK